MIRKFNIVYKLTGYLIVVSVLPLLVFVLFSYGVVRETIIDLTSENSVDQIKDQRDFLQLQVVQQIENLSNQIASNDTINSILAKSVEPGKVESSVYDELSSQEQIRANLTVFSNLKGIVSIDILGVDGHRYYVGDTLTVTPIQDAVRQKLIDLALSDPAPVHWMGVVDNLNTDSPSSKVLSAIKVLRRYVLSKQATVTIGLLIVNYSTDVLHDHFKQVDLGHGATLYILDAQQRMIYAPDRSQTGLRMPADLLGQLGSGDGHKLTMWNGGQDLIITARLSEDAWTVVGVISKDQLLAPMNRLTQLLSALIVLSFLVIGLASRYLQRTMVHPIQAISDGFHRLFDEHTRHADPLPVPYGDDEISELVRWFNTFLDTHAMRQKYEQELVESQYKFSSIFKQAPLPLALVRINSGQFVDVNESWLDQFGYTRDEVIGRTSLELNLWINQHDRTEILNRIDESFVVNRLEIRQRTKDGRVLVCEMSGRPLLFQNEEHFVFSPVDITRQRQVENDIIEMNQQLESRVQSRTEQLQRSNLELNQALDTLNLAQGELVRSEKLAALGSLVAGVAHEINTPVGIIVTSASVLSDASNALNEGIGRGPVKRTQVLDYIKVALESSELITANANRAAQLIQSFKQVAVDQTSEQRRQFELNAFVRDLIMSLNPSLKKSRIVLQLVRSPAAITMDSYPGLLAQVLTNLTMNALLHAFQGRNEGQVWIEINQNQELDLVTIRFADDGIGIAEAILDKIFDPFFTTRRGQGGTGLGLNIVYNIINKQFRGTVTAHNREGGGALFIITVPRVTRELTETEYVQGTLS